MKMRWLAAGLTGVLILGGTMTIVQRAITQKTRGVLPEANDSAHADSRRSAPVLALPSPAPAPTTPPASTPSAVDIAIATAPAEPALLIPPTDPQGASPAIPAPVNPTVALGEPAPTPEQAPPSPVAQVPTASDPGPEPARPADLAVSAAAAPAPSPVASPGPRDVLSDPVQSVESFVEQNRREADHAIQTLAGEAENLKGRLAKVEVALARWQTFSRALNADLPPGGAQPAPGSAEAKRGWSRSTPDQPGRPPAEGPVEGGNPPALAPPPGPAEAPTPEPAAAPHSLGGRLRRIQSAEAPAPEPASAPPTIPQVDAPSADPGPIPAPAPVANPAPTPSEPAVPSTASELPPPGDAPKPTAPEPTAPPLDPAPEAPPLPNAPAPR